MYNIAQFLEKFKNIGAKGLGVREAVVVVVKELFDFTLEMKNVAYKEGVVTISTNPMAKNAIFIKKVSIIDQIKVKTGVQVKDIR